MSIVFAANWSKCATFSHWLQKFKQLGAVTCTGALNTTHVVYDNEHALTSGTTALEVKVAVTANAILAAKVCATFTAYSADNRILEFQDVNGNVLAYLGFAPALNGTVALYNAAGAVLGTSTDKLSLNSATNVECELNATAETARVWLFGDASDIVLTVSGLTLANPAKVRIAGTTAVDMILHDIIIRAGDTTGLGNAFAESKMPVATSNVTNWYAPNGAALYANLSKSDPDGSNYDQADVAPAAMSVQFDDIDGDYPVLGGVVIADLWETDEAGGTARIDTVANETTTEGTVHSLTTTQTGYGEVISGVTTQAGFNAFRAVVNRVS